MCLPWSNGPGEGVVLLQTGGGPIMDLYPQYSRRGICLQTIVVVVGIHEAGIGDNRVVIKGSTCPRPAR